MEKRNRIKTRRLAISTTVFVILGSMILSTFIIFQKNKPANADGLSVADTLLIKTLKIGMQDCIANHVIKGAEVNSSSELKEKHLFYTDKDEYSKDGTVLIPFKYGKGNTIDDGNLSCKQLFNGFGDGSKNSFHTFRDLGGYDMPPYKDDYRQKSVDMTVRNKFLESFGYVSDSSISSGTVCAQVVYTAAINHSTNEYKTNKICIDPDDGGAGDAGRVFDYEEGNSQNLSLRYVPNDDIIYLDIRTAARDKTCIVGKNTEIASTPKIGKTLKSGKSATDIFKSLEDKISKTEDFLSSSAGKGIKTTGNIEEDCYGKTLKEDLNATSINLTGVVLSSPDNSGNTNSNIARTKKYTRSENAVVDLPEILKYYVPSYVDGPITDLEKAYYWYYLFNDVYKALSVDKTVPDTCVDDRASAGQNYLPYYNIAKNQNGEEVAKVQYCILDGKNLTNRSGEKIMDKAPEGMVSGITSADTMRLLNVNDVLSFLQGLDLDLPKLCSEDKNFPLCKANPDECAENPDQAGCKDLAPNATGSSEEDKEGEQAACMQKSGALGWMICPLMYGLRDTAQGIFEKAVTPMLVVHTSIVKGLADTKGEGSALYQAWSFFRNVANILFVIAMLFVIFSQITGFGIDNYGIKKILPKLIITAIIVNFSYIICGIVVDISNITGDALRGIFENIAKNTTGAPDRATITSAVTETIASLLGFVAGTVALVIPTITGVTAIAGGSFLAFIFPILAFIGSAALAGLFAMLMLGLRQALIIVMIAISPVAFVLYAIPNTNGLFKKWFTLFKTLLILYPVFCFMVGGGFLVSNIIIKGSKDVYLQIIAGLLSIMPYFAVPSMTRNAMKGFDGLVGGLGTLQQRATGLGNNLNRQVMGSDLMRSQQQNAQDYKLKRLVNKYNEMDPTKRAKLRPWQQRRIASALSTLNKDERSRAGLNAAMRTYEYNTDPRNAANINRSAMRDQNDTVQRDMMSEFRSNNMSTTDAIMELNKAQEYEYDKGTTEDNRANDNRISALTSYLASTKEGQKAFDKYVKGKYTYTDASGVKHSLPAGKSSDRAMAVISGTMRDKHSDLRDKYHTTFEHLDSKRATQDIESMTGPTQNTTTLSSGMPTTRSKVAQELEYDDYTKMGKQDFEQFYNTHKGANGAPDTYTAEYTSGKEYNHLNELANSRIKQLKSDPSLISTISDQEKRFISLYSTGNVDVSTISNVLYMKDAGGTVTGTIEQQ